MAREEAAPCLTEGMESSRLEKKRGRSSDSVGGHSTGNEDMKLPHAKQAAVVYIVCEWYKVVRSGLI